MAFKEVYNKVLEDLKGLEIEEALKGKFDGMLKSLEKEFNSDEMTNRLNYKNEIETANKTIENLTSSFEDLKTKSTVKPNEGGDVATQENEILKQKIAEYEAKEQERTLSEKEQNKLNAIKELYTKKGAKIDNYTLKGLAQEVIESETGSYVVRDTAGRVELLEDKIDSHLQANKHLISTNPIGDGSGEVGSLASSKNDKKPLPIKDLIPDVFK